MIQGLLLAGLAAGTAAAAVAAAKKNPVPDQCVNIVKAHENLRLVSYLPANDNTWTIGYGHTNGVDRGDRITVSQAEDLLRSDLSTFMKGVDRATASCRPKLNDNQRSALCSLAYNIGLGNFNSSTLLKKVIANPNDPDIAYQFSLWRRTGGQIAPGLVRRRTAEATLYFA